MSTDIEKRLVLPQAFIRNEDVSTSRNSLVHGNSNPRVSTPEHDFPLGVGKRGPNGRLIGQRSGSSPSVMHEASSWQGDDRVKLVQEGYRSLAIICTFIAGVQAQILAMTFTSTGLASQIIHAFFFAGLLANIGAATLSAASARWFEMMTPDEAKHVYGWSNSSSNEEEQGHSSFPRARNTAEEEKRQAGKDDSSAATSPQCVYIVERCLCIALRAAPFVAVLGLVFLVAGVMLWVWTHEPVVVRVLCTAMCGLLAILLPPFAMPHDRIRTLTFIKLRRFSG